MTIRICMGSSCYARGNRDNLTFIRQFIRENSLEAHLVLTGCLCTGNCQKGPVIEVDGILRSEIDPVSLKDFLETSLTET